MHWAANLGRPGGLYWWGIATLACPCEDGINWVGRVGGGDVSTSATRWAVSACRAKATLEVGVVLLPGVVDECGGVGVDMLFLFHNTSKMVAPLGFEPRLPGSEPGILPLNDRAIMVTAGGFKPPSATLKGWYPRSLDDAVVWQASQDSHLDPSGSKPGILLYTTSLLITYLLKS